MLQQIATAIAFAVVMLMLRLIVSQCPDGLGADRSSGP